MVKKIVTLFAIIGTLLAYTNISIGATQSDIDALNEKKQNAQDELDGVQDQKETATNELDQINAEDITYTVTENYLETNLIIPTNKNKPYEKLFNNYQVEVPEPFVVVNSEGEEQTTFNAKEGFKVRIPISKIQNNKLDYTINIKGIYSIPTTRIYNGWTPRRIENSEQKDNTRLIVAQFLFHPQHINPGLGFLSAVA